jgi:hypothetical protein
MQSPLSQIVESWNSFNEKLSKDFHKQKHRKILYCGLNKDIMNNKTAVFINTLPDIFLRNIGGKLRRHYRTNEK